MATAANFVSLSTEMLETFYHNKFLAFPLIMKQESKLNNDDEITGKCSTE